MSFLKKKVDVSKLLRQLDQFGEDGKRLATAITNQTASDIATQARQRAPVDLGQLRNSTGFTAADQKQNTAFIFSNAPYAPYINWGTGGLVSVEPMFKELALTYKGKGVKKINILATGFLTSPYILEGNKYRGKLELAIDKLTKQYNNKK